MQTSTPRPTAPARAVLAARAALVLAPLALFGALGAARGATPSIVAEPQAFVGVWTLLNADPKQAPTLLTLNADGTFLTSQVAGGGNTPIHGVWAPVGARRIRLSGRWLLGDNKTFTYMGSAKITGTATLASNDRFDADTTIEAFDPKGKRLFVGPSRVQGRRVALDAPR